MNDTELLHNAIRHHCIKRHGEWCEKYRQLMATDAHRDMGHSGSWTYTPEAYQIFPRYHVLAAILGEVERFVPSDFSSAFELRSLLAVAGETAQNLMTTFDEAIAIRAAEEERQQFIEFVRTVEERETANAPSYPFRRVLGDIEHSRMHNAFVERWGKWYGGAVDPPQKATPEVVTLHVAAMDEVDEAYDRLRRAVLDHGICRVLELREHGSGYELDLGGVSFMYDGAEGFWTDRSDRTWMVYASHESSITFGGTWLIDAMQESLPNVHRYIYRGWDLSIYGEPMTQSDE